MACDSVAFVDTGSLTKGGVTAFLRAARREPFSRCGSASCPIRRGG
jgi:hypothetical protein